MNVPASRQDGFSNCLFLCGFMDKIWTRITRFGRYAYLRVVRINAPAESVALGLALGVFSGALPLLSLQMVIAVTMALFLRANPIAAALGTWWSNPFNWAIIYPLFHMLGRFFVPGDAPHVSVPELIQLPLLDLLVRGWKWLLITSLGGVIAGLPMAVVVYFVSLRAVCLYRARRDRRKNERLRR
jgi:uncharacterized protein (DUF2062 family)